MPSGGAKRLSARLIGATMIWQLPPRRFKLVFGSGRPRAGRASSIQPALAPKQVSLT